MSVTCQRAKDGCDKDRTYHADCLYALYEKLGPKGSGAKVNQAVTHALDNMRFSGAHRSTRLMPPRDAPLAGARRLRATSATLDTPRAGARGPRRGA